MKKEEAIPRTKKPHKKWSEMTSQEKEELGKRVFEYMRRYYASRPSLDIIISTTKNKTDCICDDTPIEIPERIKNMSNEESETELKKESDFVLLEEQISSMESPVGEETDVRENIN